MPKRPARPLPAVKVIDLRAAGVRGVVLDWTIDVTGAILALSAPQEPRYRKPRADGFGAPQSFSPVLNRYTVHIFQDGDARRVPLAPTHENFTEVRLLAPDTLLLARIRARQGDPPSGAVYGMDGLERRRINLGDGPQHLFVTPAGSVWVACIDEAYADPRSRGGGVHLLDARGRALFDLNASGHLPECVDAYAMSMDADGTAYTATYPDFPLLRLPTRGRGRVLTTLAAAGPRVLAVRGDHYLVDGGYDDPAFLYLRSLRHRRRARVAPVTPGGRAIRSDSTFSLAGVLYLAEGPVIYAVEVPPAPARRGPRERGFLPPVRWEPRRA